MNETVRDVLAAGGSVAARLPGYEERSQQLELACAVERALAERRHLLAEAGTGVGKSFAYLLPAIQHACRYRGAGPVVVSTRTIALQQQLEQKDLPFLQQVLPLEWTSVTAVGRGNYLCLRRMNLAAREAPVLFPDPERERQLRAVVHWSISTRDGTRMQLPAPVDPAVWDEVRAEHGNCMHRACPHYEPCHYQRARRRTSGAQILVVNHALYMADVALRMAGASYLPPHAVVVFDEAHHLERTATENLGLRVTEAGVLWHLRRLQPRNAARSLLLHYGSPRSQLLAHELREVTAGFFADLDARLGGRDAIPLAGVELGHDVGDLLGDLAGELAACAAAIEDADRKMEMQARINGLMGTRQAIDALCRPADEQSVRWLERDGRGTALRAAPLEVSAALAEHVFGTGRTAVLVSATLGDDSDHEFRWLREQLGTGTADTLRLGSPFDYRRRVQVVLEEAMPDPARQPAEYAREARVRVLDHLVANGGRALVLCTSWRFVREVAEFVRPELEQRGLPLLVQGEAPLARLLDRKRREPASVLIGTDSLWAGIDVPGDALTLVVVTRLPFARPDHPLAQARMRAIERRGGNAFADHSLPEAVLKFRQGFGRLVRRTSDGGKVVILDPRTRTKAYGARFLRGLPDGALES